MSRLESGEPFVEEFTHYTHRLMAIQTATTPVALSTSIATTVENAANGQLFPTIPTVLMQPHNLPRGCIPLE